MLLSLLIGQLLKLNSHQDEGNKKNEGDGWREGELKEKELRLHSFLLQSNSRAACDGRDSEEQQTQEACSSAQ